MKILSGPEGDALLTNAEVHAWLKEKNFGIAKRDLKKDQIRTPSSIATLSKDLIAFLESAPSGNETVASVRSLFEKLEKFKLSNPELLMIANIRPEAYAQLTPLLVDVYSRFDEEQLYEMLGVINETLEKRNKPAGPDDVENKVGDPGTSEPPRDPESNGANGAGACTTPDALKNDRPTATQSLSQAKESEFPNTTGLNTDGGNEALKEGLHTLAVSDAGNTIILNPPAPGSNVGLRGQHPVETDAERRPTSQPASGPPVATGSEPSYVYVEKKEPVVKQEHDV